MESISTRLPLAQTHCAACGYCLNGLPLRGRCPECGEPYDNETLILSGWPPERLRPDATAKILSVVAMCLAVLLWVYMGIAVLGLLFSLFNPLMHWKGFGFLFLMTLGYGTAAALLQFVARSLSRWQERIRIDPRLLGKPVYQLRLMPEGYAVRRGFGPAHELFTWIPDLEIDLTLTGPVARIRIARLSPLGYTDWSTLVDFSFPATADQVTALRAYIDSLRQHVASK